MDISVKRICLPDYGPFMAVDPQGAAGACYKLTDLPECSEQGCDDGTGGQLAGLASFTVESRLHDLSLPSADIKGLKLF